MHFMTEQHMQPHHAAATAATAALALGQVQVTVARICAVKCMCLAQATLLCAAVQKRQGCAAQWSQLCPLRCGSVHADDSSFVQPAIDLIKLGMCFLLLLTFSSMSCSRCSREGLNSTVPWPLDSK
jgi:hypothetical protein